MSDHPLPPAPSSILIVGAGVFGLSTALALLSSPRYRDTRITILDSRTPTPSSGPEHVNPPTASIDSSRIVRADYPRPPYAHLAASAQTLWRQSWGGPTAYHESGLCFTSSLHGPGSDYVRFSLENVRALNHADSISEKAIEFLQDATEIKRMMKATGGGSGDWGYVNWRSGWVDAEAAIVVTRRRIRDLAATHPGGLAWIHGSASRLLFSSSPLPSTHRTITGVQLATHVPLLAALIILATGAYTPLLLPRSLSTRVTATGQAMAYVQLTPAETARLAAMPVLLNESSGMFLIPPTATGVLKVARHGFGYRNTMRVAPAACERPRGSGEARGDNDDGTVAVSVPADDYTTLPPEATRALRGALASMVPWLADRAFSGTRLCWYADTPTGDFLIDYVPGFGRSLVVATGGSGHGFKFLPVLGAKVVARVQGRLGGEGRGGGDGGVGKCGEWDADLGRLWAWGEGREGEWECEDGSRGGERGMGYWVEMAGGGECGWGGEGGEVVGGRGGRRVGEEWSGEGKQG